MNHFPNLAGVNSVGISKKGQEIFVGASFINANLTRADLRFNDFRGADFRGAKLTGTDLRGSNVDGADFRGFSPLDPVFIGVDITKAIF